MPSHSILNKNKDLGNYDKYLPLRDCFLAGQSINTFIRAEMKPGPKLGNAGLPQKSSFGAP